MSPDIKLQLVIVRRIQWFTDHWWTKGTVLHSSEATILSCWSSPRSQGFSGNQTPARGFGRCCKHCTLLDIVAESYSKWQITDQGVSYTAAAELCCKQEISVSAAVSNVKQVSTKSECDRLFLQPGIWSEQTHLWLLLKDDNTAPLVPRGQQLPGVVEFNSWNDVSCWVKLEYNQTLCAFSEFVLVAGSRLCDSNVWHTWKSFCTFLKSLHIMHFSLTVHLFLFCPLYEYTEQWCMCTSVTDLKSTKHS